MMQAVTDPGEPCEHSAPPPPELAGWLRRVADSGDREAFEALFRHFAPRVKSYMRRLGCDAATAEDLAQETLVQVWRKAGSYDPAKAAASSWVFAVARNLRIDRLRRQRFQEVELDDQAEGEDERADGHERVPERLDAQRLAAAVETLPPDQSQVVRLAYFEGLSQSEIGARLQVPLGTVKSRMRLAFAKLRTAVGA
jgi:RNA polymerase sigma-70 factor (ECF subfamily)